jgi:hypothetical protein
MLILEELLGMISEATGVMEMLELRFGTSAGGNEDGNIIIFFLHIKVPHENINSFDDMTNRYILKIQLNCST